MIDRKQRGELGTVRPAITTPKTTDIKKSFTLLALFAAATFTLAGKHADQGHVTTKHKLTLEGAKKVGEAGAAVFETKLSKKQWRVCSCWTRKV